MVRRGKHTPLGPSVDYAIHESQKILDASEEIRYSLASERDIVSASRPITKICGIYFLVRNERVVYVGQTLDIEDRVREHVLHGKRFDRYYWVKCAPEDRLKLEAVYIKELRPEENFKRPHPMNRQPDPIMSFT